MKIYILTISDIIITTYLTIPTKEQVKDILYKYLDRYNRSIVGDIDYQKIIDKQNSSLKITIKYGSGIISYEYISLCEYTEGELYNYNMGHII